MSRTVTNELRTATAQNVAVMKLNGAQDINQDSFLGFFAPEWGAQTWLMHQQLHRYREQAHSYRGTHYNCRSEPAREGCDSMVLKNRAKKTEPEGSALYATNPNQASFLWRTRCGWAAASPRRFLRSASYSV
ncbi:hypothetical protein EMIT0215P_40237 [Pseudomonas serboccidentalis]